MARDIICDVDHVEYARWLVGDLRSGDQVGLCDEHFVAWSLAQVDTMLDEGQRLVAISKLAAKLPEPPTEETGPEPEPKSDVAAPDTSGGDLDVAGAAIEPRRRGRTRQRFPAAVAEDWAGDVQAGAQAVAETIVQPAPEAVAGEAPAADDG